LNASIQTGRMLPVASFTADGCWSLTMNSVETHCRNTDTARARVNAVYWLAHELPSGDMGDGHVPALSQE
jgi:hypothetical protein